ncbi:MAG: carbohydrate kinase [Alphaproteobacteria bacterium]|nr:carbohydrate kinase [Alphaproteobacteria bacterium]
MELRADRGDVFIGLDSGTSVVKAIAFDRAGRQIAMAAAPNRTIAVGHGGVEQDMDDVWRSAAQVVAALGERVPDLARRAAALAVTAQGDGTWLIDGRGAPVGRAWLWLDGRGGAIVDELRRDGTDAAVFRATGTVLSPSLQSAQLLAMRRHAPEKLARASHALHCKDWLYYKLAGEIGTDPCEGVNTYGDVLARRYDDGVLERLGLYAERRLLPEIVDGTAHCGRLAPEAARATALPAGLPVVLAPVDYLATAIGGGVLGDSDDIGCSVLGSAGMHLMLLADPVAATQGAPCGYTVLFPRPGTWLRMVSNMATSLNVDWLVGLAADAAERITGTTVDRRRVLGLLDEGAARAAPGAALYHPYISEAGERGPFVEPRARAQFHGLSTRTTIDDLMRAVLEGIVFAARDCYAAMPVQPRELRLAGGAARSATVRQAMAAALRARVRRSGHDEAGALGAVAVAAVGLGAFASIDAACVAWVDPQLGAAEIAEPALADRYEQIFSAYRVGREDSRRVWSSLHETGRH